MKINHRLLLCLAFAAFLLPLTILAQSGPPPLPSNPDIILNTWTLDDGPAWHSWYDDTPRSATNLTVVPSWLGTALNVSTNLNAWLNYDVYNSDGSTNVSFTDGTILEWYSPDFSSVTQGGTGPGEWASLLTVGRFDVGAAYGCWSLAIDPYGTNLVFVAQTNGASQSVFSIPIDWVAGDWHFLAITYSATNCVLYLESVSITNAPPILYWPSVAECVSDGMWIGSAPGGDNQGHGTFQFLRTFNYAVDPSEIEGAYDLQSGEIADWGGSLPLSGGFSGAQDVPSLPGGFGGGSGTNPPTPLISPSYTNTTSYALYTNFWLSVTNDPTNAYVAIQNTLSNLTYQILTNGDPGLALTNWGVWQTFLATNSVTPAPPMALGSNGMLFKAQLIPVTTTNGLPDYWCMEYFGTLAVNPYADPDGDGLCNWDECYISHTIPTNANTLSGSHTDSQAWLLAYTNDSACVHQLSVTNSGANAVILTLWPTLVGTNYQIYCQVRWIGYILLDRS